MYYVDALKLIRSYLTGNSSHTYMWIQCQFCWQSYKWNLFSSSIVIKPVLSYKTLPSQWSAQMLSLMTKRRKAFQYCAQETVYEFCKLSVSRAFNLLVNSEKNQFTSCLQNAECLQDFGLVWFIFLFVFPQILDLHMILQKSVSIFEEFTFVSWHHGPRPTQDN